MKTRRGILLVLTVSLALCFISNFAFGADSLYVDPSGNVGVNNSSPSYPLDIKGNMRLTNDADTNLFLKSPGGSGNSLLWWKDNSNHNDFFFGQISEKSSLYLYNYGISEYSLIVQRNGNVGVVNDRLFVQQSTGNVGIGTTNPGKALQIDTLGLGSSDTVTSSSVGGIFIKGTQSDENYGDVGIILGFATGSSYNSFISSHKTAVNNNDLVFGTHDAERIRIKGNGTVQPGADDGQDFGSPSRRWKDIYATNGTIQTSDERHKDNIRNISLGLDFITQLRPIAYRWKDYHVPEVKEAIATERQKTRRVTKEVKEDVIELVNGKYVKASRVEVKEVEEPVFEEHPLYDESGQKVGTHIIPVMETVEEEVIVQKERNETFTRTHYGLSAQQVKATIDKFGVDFDGVVYHEENDTYGIRMGEFVPILMKAVQELKAEVDQLKAEISALKK